MQGENTRQEAICRGFRDERLGGLVMVAGLCCRWLKLAGTLERGRMLYDVIFKLLGGATILHAVVEGIG